VKEEVKVHNKNIIFHRIIKGFMVQGGDTTNQNGADVQLPDIGPTDVGVFPARRAAGAGEPQETPGNGEVGEQMGLVSSSADTTVKIYAFDITSQPHLRS
jgi:cyclophilin family peptidyl-prolyl cis-trans isomerase